MSIYTPYTPDELDILHYAEEFNDALTDRYYPKEIRRPAYDTMIALSKLALVIKNQPIPAETWPKYSESIDRIGEAAIDVAVVIFRNLPMSSMVLMEHEDYLAHAKGYRRYDRSRKYENRTREGELLTQTEKELAQHLYRGLSPTEIAEVTSRKRTNVTSHLQNAYKKLGASGPNSREVAVKKLFELGIFADEEPIHPEPFTLTARQKTVLELLMEGVSREETAKRLDISRKAVVYEVLRVKKNLGIDESHAVVRAVLEAGGLEAINEPKAEYKNQKFLDEVEMPEVRYGLYSQWLTEIFSSFPNIPFNREAIAKILYGEQYSAVNRQIFINRINAMLQNIETKHEGKGSLNVRPRLARAGLQLTQINLPKSGQASARRYVSHSEALKEPEFYVGKDLSDEEIKRFAIKLRQEEIRRQRGESPRVAGLEELSTWSEGEIIEVAIQYKLKEQLNDIK